MVRLSPWVYWYIGFDDSPSADGSREHVKRARATFTDSEMYGACTDRLITIRIYTGEWRKHLQPVKLNAHTLHTWVCSVYTRTLLSLSLVLFFNTRDANPVRTGHVNQSLYTYTCIYLHSKSTFSFFFFHASLIFQLFFLFPFFYYTPRNTY